MTDEQSRNAAPTFDTSVPHPARVYNAILGGKDNFAADRAAAEAGQPRVPGPRGALPSRGGGDTPVP